MIDDWNKSHRSHWFSTLVSNAKVTWGIKFGSPSILRKYFIYNWHIALNRDSVQTTSIWKVPVIQIKWRLPYLVAFHWMEVTIGFFIVCQTLILPTLEVPSINATQSIVAFLQASAQPQRMPWDVILSECRRCYWYWLCSYHLLLQNHSDIETSHWAQNRMEWLVNVSWKSEIILSITLSASITCTGNDMQQ